MSHSPENAWPPLPFVFRNNALCCEDMPVADLVARYGTPLYIYSARHVRQQIAALRSAFSAFSPLLCYAVKANDNHGILELCLNADTGFDIVSGGELMRVLRAGADPENVVFSGVGKTDDELAQAIRHQVRSINLESNAEADRVIAVAGHLGRKASVAVRVNPDVDARTHPKIATGLSTSKFGIDMAQAEPLIARLNQDSHVTFTGLACHIGSQLVNPEPIVAALKRVLHLVDTLTQQGIAVNHLDLGGGFGIRYRADDPVLDIAALGAQMAEELTGFPGRVMLEPGRYLVGNAGILCTSVVQEKTNTAGTRLVVVDAAMNDLLRPALYDAHHDVVPITQQGIAAAADVVGPVCESSDVLATDVPLPPLLSGDTLAILSAGAYGSVMCGTYNSRPRPAEVLVDGNRAALMRPRETPEDMLARDVVEMNWHTL